MTTKRTLGRRKFLKQAGVGVAGLTSFDWRVLGSTDRTAAVDLPPHRPLIVPGVHAYADQTSVAAGQQIQFHVSSSVAYQMSVCRLGLKADDPSGDEPLHEFPVSQPRSQAIHPGSYIAIQKRFRGRLA